MKVFVIACLAAFIIGFTNLSLAQDNDCPGIFSPQIFYPVNSKPISIYSGDLDNDGDMDIAVACYFREFMSVILNNGDGTFGIYNWYLVPYYTEWVDGADLDGDDDIDIVTANSQDGNVSVLFNNGDGTFARRAFYTTYGNPRSVCLAKLDADDDVDMVTANYWNGRISVLMNNGDGTFAGYVDYLVNGNPRAVLAADLDGDQDNDLVTANMESNTVTVLRNDGNGNFTIRGVHPTGAAPFMVHAADFNGDDDLDLVTVDSDNNTVSVLLNTGYGATFGSPTSFEVGREPVFVTSFDVDKDGDPDLASANSGDSTVSVLINNGEANFGHRTSYPAGVHPYSIAVADFDDDDDLDLGVALFMSNYVSILKNMDAVPFTGTVAGTVNDIQAEAIIGAYVYATESSSVDTTGPVGGYILSGICAAEHDIHYTHPDFCDTVITGIRVPTDDVYYLDLIMNYRSIYGHVTDEDLAPIEGVYVETSNSEFSDTTNSAGKYHLGGLGPGPHDLIFSHPQFSDTSIFGVDAPLNDTTVIDMRMQPRGFIKGVVTDQLAQPLENILVEALNTSIFDSTGSDGSYFLDYLNVGNYNLHFSNPYYYEITVVNITVLPGDTTTVDIELTRRPDIELWYGTIACEPIIATIGSRQSVDVYMRTAGDFQLEAANFILAVDDRYMDSLLGEVEGEFYYPFTAMTQAGFSSPVGSPPNLAGWTGQAFSAQASIEQSPWFNFDSPTLVMRFVVIVTDDTTVVGDTVDCFARGVDQFGDSSSVYGFEDMPLTLIENFCQMAITDSYRYLPGDANMFNGDWPPQVIGGDVTYLVNYFRSVPSSQACPFDGFWASADINGDCLIIGSDATRLVNYFRGSADMNFCPDYQPLWLTPNDIPDLAPIDWPGCDNTR